MDTNKKELLRILYALNEDADEDFESSSSSSSSSSSEESDVEMEDHPKCQNFLETIDIFNDNDFKSHMRLKRSTVNYLIGRYSESNPVEGNNPGNLKISPTAHVYMYIWYISNTVTFRQLANLFGVAKSTAWTSVRKTSAWLISIGHEFLSWPTGSRVEVTCRKFEIKNKIPGVIGAIDGSHIHINAPRVSKENYFNRKQVYSIVLQGVVDADKIFTNVYCGEPGSLHDSRVLRRSEIYSDAQSNYLSLFPNLTFLLGDSAYASSRWIVTPFENNGNLTDAQRHFNFIHSSTRIAVENAFGLLKGRFRRLMHFTEQRFLCSVTNLVVSACILHNLCMKSHDMWESNDAPETSENSAPESESTELGHGATDQDCGTTERRARLFNYLIDKNIL